MFLCDISNANVIDIGGVQYQRVVARNLNREVRKFNLPITLSPNKYSFSEYDIQLIHNNSFRFLVVEKSRCSAVEYEDLSKSMLNLFKEIYEVAIPDMSHCSIVIKYSETTGLILSRLVNLDSWGAVQSIYACIRNETSCEWSSSILREGNSGSYDPFNGLTKKLFNWVSFMYSNTEAIVLEYIKGKISSVIVYK